MNKFLSRTILFLALVVVAPAWAANTQTWVSSTGNDMTNNCLTPATACATFAGAIGKTPINGQVLCASAGNFGPITVNKSLTIDCGAFLNNDAASGGVTISTAAAALVVLRGLTIFSPNSDGIQISGGGSVILDKIKVIQSLQNALNVPCSATTKLSISDSDFSGSLLNGINLAPASGIALSFTIKDSRVRNNGNSGISADGTSNGTIKGLIERTLVSDNASFGVLTGSAGSSVVVTIDNSEIVNNLIGLQAQGANEGIIVGRSIINSNLNGVSPFNGGVIYSYGDNRVNGNTSGDGFFTASIPTR
jgi:hypothetical protein